MNWDTRRLRDSAEAIGARIVSDVVADLEAAGETVSEELRSRLAALAADTAIVHTYALIGGANAPELDALRESLEARAKALRAGASIAVGGAYNRVVGSLFDATRELLLATLSASV